MNIQVENLYKSFYLDHNIETKALRGINLKINSGDKVSIVGPSGAGKSTLLHILGLMDSATSGRLMLDDADFTKATDKERSDVRKKKIGFLFQMHYLLPDFTVWENLLIPVWENRIPKNDEALSLLERLGLQDRLRHLPGELSGGEQQRVALARALITDPKLLLADEPTGNLDRETGSKVEEIIFGECNKRGITLIVVTHNKELAQKSDYIIEMRDGMISSS